jgi:hypothetical protein
MVDTEQPDIQITPIKCLLNIVEPDKCFGVVVKAGYWKFWVPASPGIKVELLRHESGAITVQVGTASGQSYTGRSVTVFAEYPPDREHVAMDTYHGVIDRCRVLGVEVEE